MFPKGTAMLLNNANENECVLLLTVCWDLSLSHPGSGVLYLRTCMSKAAGAAVEERYEWRIIFTPRTVHYEGGAVSNHARSLWRLETLRVVWVQHTHTHARNKDHRTHIIATNRWVLFVQMNTRHLCCHSFYLLSGCLQPQLGIPHRIKSLAWIGGTVGSRVLEYMLKILQLFTHSMCVNSYSFSL